MKNTKKLSPYEEFMALSDAQKESVYRELDALETPYDIKPLSPELRRLWNRAKRKAGRPRIGRGAARVLVSIERGLLEQADSLARRQHTTRSDLISRGLKAVLAIAG